MWTGRYFKPTGFLRLAIAVRYAIALRFNGTTGKISDLSAEGPCTAWPFSSSIDLIPIECGQYGNMRKITLRKTTQENLLELLGKGRLRREGCFHGFQQLCHTVHLSVKERIFVIQQIIFQLLKDGEISIDFFVKYFLKMLIIALALFLMGVCTRDYTG